MPRPRPWAVVPALTWAILSGSSVLALTAQGVYDVDEPKTFLAQISSCPAPCAGRDPADWTVYSSIETLATCDQPILFDVNIYNPLSDPSNTVLLRACTSTKGEQAKQAKTDNEKRDGVACVSGATESRVSLQISRDGASSKQENKDSFVQALNEMKTYADETGVPAGCGKDQTLMLSYFKGIIAGAFAGPALDKSTIPSMVDDILNHSAKSDLSASNFFIQVCGDDRDLQHTAGLVVASAKDITYVRSALQSWNDGKCAEQKSSKKRAVTVLTKNFLIIELVEQFSGVSANNMTIFNTTSTLSAKQSPKRTSHSRSLLAERADGYCPTQTVPPGGSCDGLARACKISTADLFKYNNAGNGQDWCRKLQVGQKVCCGPGSLKPLPGGDGTCFTYTIKAGDDCSRIGVGYSLTPQEIATFNDKTTWGWKGCQYLSVGMRICLSKGYSPMPAPLGDATCGPQKPGTFVNGTIKDSAALVNLNPCPLNSCCNIWGNCGIDSKFCTKADGPTGNPGTSPPNVFGCISNCGMDIVNNKPQPPQYQRVGYYEAFNWDRACLHQRAEWSNTLSYTHMHWAFADVTSDMKISVNDTRGQWQGFLALSASKTKRIVSFGGWGFSTDPATYQVLRKAMFPENRDTFAANIVNFVKSNGLDGVDIDWEYPGAPDIPGVPVGLPSDGPNYLAFLRTLRKALPLQYSLSIAAPASYWYLKPFPIKEMGEVVDYIVYMTYDLHGQWDYGSKWAMDGCPAGNCLRSHVNQTEVVLALSMITKAGVPANKIMVGESSYGRSFHMSSPGCMGPECTFTGTNTRSDAAKGRCTNTGGYLSNAEIKEIIARPPGSVKTWYDEQTASDYLVYNNVEWVAYMTDKTKQTRRDKWKGLNFLGTIDWATDLQAFGPSDTLGPVGDYNQSSCINVFDGMIWNWINPVIEAPPGCTNLLKPSPLATKVTLTAYTTITIKSGGSLSSTIISAPFDVSEIGYQPFTFDTTDLDKGASLLTYNPIPRITPEPTTVRLPPGWTPLFNPIPQPGSPVGTDPSGPNPTGNPGDPGNPGTPGHPGPNPTTTTTTTQDPGGGLLLPITWQPTISYPIPPNSSPKVPAPTEVPDDPDHPGPPPPPPGVPDCIGDNCTKGPDCDDDNCTRGGDCIGPNCISGGDCRKLKCLRGGDCIGPKCEKGGDCENDHDCEQGGGCQGGNCHSGGGCTGPHCKKGGDCTKHKYGDCGSGGCKGDNCHGKGNCGIFCQFLTISVLPKITPIPIPKPICLFNCPKLPGCPDGGIGCNAPCGLHNCPPGRMPTAKACTTLQTGQDCTEFVSSTQVQRTPTTSWSTTTRTKCETVYDCEPMDMTVTTTITSTPKADPTMEPKIIKDGPPNGDLSEDEKKALRDAYDAWQKMLEGPPPPPPPPPEPTEQPKPKTAVCDFWDQDSIAYLFIIHDISGWGDEHGYDLRHEEKGCGALTSWEWHDADGTKLAFTKFNLPTIIKAGCVERAIVSAGGPKIQCKGRGVITTGVNATASEPSQPHPDYIPMDWDNPEMTQ